MDKPLKHAPGVLCIIQGLSVAKLNRPVAGVAPLPTFVAEAVVREREGLVVELVASVPVGGVTTSDTLNLYQSPRWEVRGRKQLHGIIRKLHKETGEAQFRKLHLQNTVLVLQEFLIPIAGPDLQVSENEQIQKTSERVS